jgi:DNA-binding response OmpR family regulator
MTVAIDRPITLVIADNDPIFRLGLVQTLARVDSIELLADGDVETLLTSTIEPNPRILLLDPLRGNTLDWSVCRSLQARYPHSELVLFTFPLDTRQQLIARDCEIVHYIAKGISLEELIAILGRIARENETYWTNYPDSALVPRPVLPTTHWLIQTGRSGLSRVEEELGAIEARLQRSNLSPFDRFYWLGRRRELLASSWLVRKLIPVETTYQALPFLPVDPLAIPAEEVSLLTRSRPLSTAVVFEDTLAEIRSCPRNTTDIPLEIDVLQDSRQRELLYLVLDNTRKAIDELRFLGIDEEELGRRQTFLVYDIWEESSRNFLSIHFLGKTSITKEAIDTMILEERELIQEEILDKIPFLSDLFGDLVLEKGLMIDRTPYRANAPETIERAEILLQNLIHHLANAVMVVVLNHFSESEAVKRELFRSQYLSSREIAKTRNELSWRYRRERYWDEPKWIFESKYRLFRYRNGAIVPLYIYAPRQEELNRLSGIRWWVSIALETRDALSPRLRAFFSVTGKGVVYFLVQVIGRGIGLVIRGVLQGVGNTWQEVKGKK